MPPGVYECRAEGRTTYRFDMSTVEAVQGVGVSYVTFTDIDTGHKVKISTNDTGVEYDCSHRVADAPDKKDQVNEQ